MRVVVAEDEALIRLDLVEMLAEAGYEVVGQAATGEAAVELVGRVRPDVALLDIRMPVMDGLAAAQAIPPNIDAVVMLTAFSDRDLWHEPATPGWPATWSSRLPPEIWCRRSSWRRPLLRTDRPAARCRGAGGQAGHPQDAGPAKAGCAARLGLDDEQAYRWLQRTAMDRRTSMAAIAEELLANR